MAVIRLVINYTQHWLKKAMTCTV